jgi:hypothetical protein
VILSSLKEFGDRSDLRVKNIATATITGRIAENNQIDLQGRNNKNPTKNIGIKDSPNE